jgi:hypothetical protein
MRIGNSTGEIDRIVSGCSEGPKGMFYLAKLGAFIL